MRHSPLPLLADLFINPVLSDAEPVEWAKLARATGDDSGQKVKDIYGDERRLDDQWVDIRANLRGFGPAVLKKSVSGTVMVQLVLAEDTARARRLLAA